MIPEGAALPFPSMAPATAAPSPMALTSPTSSPNRAAWLDADSPASRAYAAAALLWLPQAALLALAVQRLASGQGPAAVRWPAAGFLVIGLMRALIEARASRRIFAAAREHLSTLRAQAAASLSAASPFDRGRPHSGAAASVVAEQAEAIVPYLVRYRPARWRATMVPPVIVVAVATQSWAAALVLLVAAPLIPVFMVIVGLRAQAASKAQLVEMGGMNAFLLDRLRGLATLRALDAVDATAARLDDVSQSLRRRTMAVLRIAFLSSAVLELFSALGVAMVAAYVGFHLLGTLHFGTWGERLGLGQGLFILLLAPAFFEPLRELAAVWHDAAAGKAALQSLEGLAHHRMRLPGGSARGDGVTSGPARFASPPSVETRDLAFAFPDRSPVFAGLDLRVSGGEHVALVGPSGSGKTVLLALLAGLVPAVGGTIAIDGVVLSDRNVTALRRRIGWMGQHPHVFADTIEGNATLGRADRCPSGIPPAERLAALGLLARARPSTALGEDGSGLSGGEVVRLALARLAVHDAADLLLVDEPTAHLDVETATRVGDALLALARGRTLIVATHDPALASRMGRVLRLDASRIEEAA